MYGWKSIAQSLLVASLILAMGCGAHVRDDRTQSPIYEVEEQTDIALASVEVPEWVQDDMPDSEDPDVLLARVLPGAFDGTNYDVVDRTDEGFEMPVGPDTEPQILDSANRVAPIGQPYEYDHDNRPEVYGAPPVQWEVVEGPNNFRIDDETGEIDWIPQQLGTTEVTLAAKNEVGEDEFTFEIEVKDDDAEPRHRSPTSPRVGSSQEFAGAAPIDVPDSIEEPLLLGVHVIDWNESTYDPDFGDEVRQANTDVAYTLWTRAGEHVETRRVQLSGIPEGLASDEIDVVPAWPSWIEDVWNSSPDAAPSASNEDEDRIFEHAADANAHGFSFLFGTHSEPYSAFLYEEPFLEEGNELMDQEDWAGAYEEFKEAVEQHSGRSEAHYNLALAAEMKGDDATAYEHYSRARELGGRTTYRLHRDQAERRMEMRTDLTPKVEEARAQLEEERADDEPAADTDEEVEETEEVEEADDVEEAEEAEEVETDDDEEDAEEAEVEEPQS